ncbi:hypothetical protein N7454_010750 [Penicillium verhagenii]|nr:hypothetical protein N7454_010750 [Penicillium verhagenii]
MSEYSYREFQFQHLNSNGERNWKEWMDKGANPKFDYYLLCNMIHGKRIPSTYDHRVWRTGLPVRSAVLKPHAGQLVVWWVTTCES